MPLHRVSPISFLIVSTCFIQSLYSLHTDSKPLIKTNISFIRMDSKTLSCDAANMKITPKAAWFG